MRLFAHTNARMIRGRRWPIALYSVKRYIALYSVIHFVKYNMPNCCPADSLVSGAPRGTGWT